MLGLAHNQPRSTSANVEDPPSPGIQGIPGRRPRRLRKKESIRKLVRETELLPRQLVLPIFLIEGDKQREPIEALPGISRVSIDLAVEDCSDAMELDVNSFALFPVIDPSLKNAEADEAINPDNLLCRTVRQLRESLPEACLITDVALDPYSSLGHDGLVSDDGVILNDETVVLLAQMAVLHAECGADFVAPSDMMDGRVGAIRSLLDSSGYTDTGIISYTAKYASALYGPFREALDSAPVNVANVPKDKKTYQMDPANVREALIEAALDTVEHADIMMVKPALPYLDVIAHLKAESDIPIAAYHVSGEYAMVKAAAQRGWLDEEACFDEMLTSIARAGANIIFTYAATYYARRWRERYK